MNMVKSIRVASQIPKEFSSTQSFIVVKRLTAVALIAMLLLAGLVSTTEKTASEAQFDAKLKSAAATVDSGFSNVSKFFPASFR